MPLLSFNHENKEHRAIDSPQKLMLQIYLCDKPFAEQIVSKCFSIAVCQQPNLLTLLLLILSLYYSTAGGAAPAAAAPAAKAEKPVEEEVDALDGGMDMFGGGGAKTGDY